MWSIYLNFQIANDMCDSQEILVSVCCAAYNHSAYIRQCLDGFIMQKTNFRFDVLIHDDASTDGTQDIIREYEMKHPDIIKPIYQTENQYCKGGKISLRFNIPRAKGKYIAFCEGDDYWIDPLKLQKQVYFMEANPICNICSSGYLRKKGNKIISLELRRSSSGGIWYGLEDINHYWYCKTLTVLFRKEYIQDYSLFIAKLKFCRDYHFVYYLLKRGKGYYFSEPFGVYNMHAGGVCSLIPLSRKSINRYTCMKELYLKVGDSVTRIGLFSSIMARIRYKGYTSRKELLCLLGECMSHIVVAPRYLYNYVRHYIEC